MSHYRAVMATTVDCEGCEFDSPEECKSEEGCVRLSSPKPKHDFSNLSIEDLTEEIISRLK